MCEATFSIKTSTISFYILMLFFYLFWDMQQDGDKICENTIKAAQEIFITIVLMSCYMVGFFVF